MFWSKARKITHLQLDLEASKAEARAMTRMRDNAREEVKKLSEECGVLKKARDLIIQEFELKKNDYELLASTYTDTRNVIDSKDRSIEELKEMLEACEAQVRALQKELLESRAGLSDIPEEVKLARRDEPIFQIDEYTGAATALPLEADSLFVSKDSGT